MIIFIVSDVKCVKFVEDIKEEDDIIIVIIRILEEIIIILILCVDVIEKVFICISCCDGRDGENGMWFFVVVNLDMFDIMLKEDGEYVMDVWV